jgi:hypothetical protein
LEGTKVMCVDLCEVGEALRGGRDIMGDGRW